MTTITKKASVVAVLLFGIAGHTWAQTVVARYLEFGATATDNPALTDEGSDSELVATIKPSVELKFSGNRFGTIVVGEVEHFRYTDAERDITDPRLFARTRGTLIDNLLYLDTAFTYYKLAPDSNFLRPTDDNEPAMDLKGRLFVFRDFGQLAEMYVGLNHNSFFEDVGESATSRENGIDFSVGKNPKYGGFIWGFGGFYSNDESDSNTFENSSYYASVGGVFSKTLFAEVQVGQESREFITGTNTGNPTILDDDDDSVWNVGFTWSPSEQTQLTLGYGERFFGRGPNMSLSHRTLNSVIKMTYTRDVSRFGPALSGISTLGPGDDSLLDPSTVNLDGASLASELDEPFVDNQLRFSYKLTGRRSDIIFDAVYSDQEQLGGSEEIESWLGRVVFDRKLSDLTLLRLQYDHQRSDAPQRTDRNYTENRFALKFIINFDRVDSSRDEEFAE